MRILRLLAPLALGAVAFAGFAAIARSATDVTTSVSVTQDPAYVYVGDQVTLTATVTPNPGSGQVAFTFGGQNRTLVPVQSDGTASIVVTAAENLNDVMEVEADFYAQPGYAGSGGFLIVDMRFLPNVVIANPPTATQATSASIAFDVSEGITTQCRIDGGTWKACTSPWTKSNLAEGMHTFEVLPTNADGRHGGVASATWAIDRTPPVPGTLALNHGIPSTNHGIVWLDHPATDSLSGIKWVRVSRTGQLDSDGNLWLDDGQGISYQRAWDQMPGQGHDWSVNIYLGGTQSAWVQWFDAAGNASAIETVSIAVRSAAPRLGGLWSTTGEVVPFSIAGVSGSEIKGLKIANGSHELDDHVSPPHRS